MQAEFDPTKNALNLRKHGLDLSFGERVLLDRNLIEAIDTSVEYGEERINALGLVEGKVYVVTYTERSDSIRFISVRMADKREIARYFRAET